MALLFFFWTKLEVIGALLAWGNVVWKQYSTQSTHLYNALWQRLRWTLNSTLFNEWPSVTHGCPACPGKDANLHDTGPTCSLLRKKEKRKTVGMQRDPSHIVKNSTRLVQQCLIHIRYIGTTPARQSRINRHHIANMALIRLIHLLVHSVNSRSWKSWVDIMLI